MEIVERKEFNGIRINEEQISEFNVGINPKNHTGLFVMERLVDCNRHCNIIDIIWHNYSVVWLCFYYNE